MIKINNLEIRKEFENGHLGYNVYDLGMCFARFYSLKRAIRCVLEQSWRYFYLNINV